MSYLDSYASRVGYLDPNMRDRRVKLAVEKERRVFSQDPSAYTVQALEPNTDTLITKRIRMINESVLKQLNPERVYSKYFVPHVDENMISGTMIFGLDKRDYLVTAVTTAGDLHQQAVSQKMNSNVEFMLNGTKVTHPAVVLAISKMADAIEEMKLITIPDSMVRVRIQSNAQTRSVKINQRLRVANGMYLLTRIDDFTDENVLNWNLIEELEVDSDNLDAVIPPTLSTISGPETVTRGRDYIYSLREGEAQSWSLVGGDGIVVIKEQSADRAIIRVEKTVLTTFQLVVKLVDETEVSREIRIVSLL